MNYDVFLQLQNGELCRSEAETEQAFMERIMAAAYVRQDAAAERIYEKLTPGFLRCDAKAQSISVVFTAEDWMLNPQNTLHGGIYSTAMDMTMSLLARYLRKTRGTATVQLSLNFLRPINKGETFIVTATADHTGRRSTVIHAELTVEATGKRAATASGVFM